MTVSGTGVVAPLLIGVVSMVRLDGFVFLSVVAAFVAGGFCFLCGEVVASASRA